MAGVGELPDDVTKRASSSFSVAPADRVLENPTRALEHLLVVRCSFISVSDRSIARPLSPARRALRPG